MGAIDAFFGICVPISIVFQPIQHRSGGLCDFWAREGAGTPKKRSKICSARFCSLEYVLPSSGDPSQEQAVLQRIALWFVTYFELPSTLECFEMNASPQTNRPVTPEKVLHETTVDQCRPACPVCGGSLIDIRAKLQCSKCHRICETCCEGGRG